MGLRLDGQNGQKSITYKLSMGAMHHDPDVQRMDFDSPANNKSDWNEGYLFAGRIDVFPWGFMKFEQGDFERGPMRANFSVAGYYWKNDDDVNTYTVNGTGINPDKADLDESAGFELSAGLRGRGFSADIEYNLIAADTVDSAFTGGLYRNGSTDLDKFSIVGGYMLPGNRLELVSKYQSLDADNYDDTWEAVELGANYFFNKYKLKAQLTLRHGMNRSGESGRDANSVQAQFQFVF